MDEQVMVLKALADPTRLKLFKLILVEELCVCELQPLLGISQPAVSQHIAKLKAARLLSERKAGMWTYYRGDQRKLRDAMSAVSALLDADPNTIPEMAEQVERRRSLNRAELCCNPKEGSCK